MSRPKDLNAPSRWNMRIWDDYRKEWLCQSDKDALTYYGFDITGGETTEFQGFPKWHPDRHLIWEQSTGLKDENGKEIYEGDIVTVMGYGTYEVFWREWDRSFSLKPIDTVKEETRILMLCGDWDGDYGVIGNIHENQELLGGEE